ncbi:MAG: biopolymer transporter ExbD [Terrimicrobiaceae bacterium]
MQLKRKDVQTVEMQMGPMIDMVFLLLVFFMVTAKPIKQESDISMALPGTAAQEEALEIPDEQQLAIMADGTIVLNELPVATPADRDMPRLFSILRRFKQSADASKSEALVTISADDRSQHQRIVDVLNVCARAGISGVTFSQSGGEEML